MIEAPAVNRITPVYYNEHDKFAAAWLRELMKDNLIAPGEVDERSIEDVTPDELRSFRQCHFFAGIGVWSIAARLAGIDDDATLWSGSCPCQPFSQAGKGEGFADERHLWPAFHYLIEQCGPALVVGEQVAGADGDAWFDLVSADLDATGYAFGAAETCAAGFGAPHIRSRNYWLAHRVGARLEGFGGHVLDGDQSRWLRALAPRPAPAGGIVDRLADAADERYDRGRAGEASLEPGEIERLERFRHAGGGVAHADGGLGGDRDAQRSGQHGLEPQDGGAVRPGDRGARSGPAVRMERPGPTNGLWRDTDWLLCRDGRWRPVESSPLALADARTIRAFLDAGGRARDAFNFPLAEKGEIKNRVGLLRGAGNAVNLAQAQGFLVAVKACLL